MAKRALPLPESPGPEIDPQELAERQAAAEAYAGENEQHFVRFMDDCVQTSVNAMIEVRLQQEECWRVFNEEEPYNFALKENWQSRVIVPKPYSSCQFGMAIVRKAFDMDFLSIENEKDETAAAFWQKLMMTMLSRNYANFPINFTDATGMSLAVGQSMEMIPVWRPGKGLRYILTEPWKIHRDPDAVSRQPQSGMFWVHQEHLDYYLLKEFEKQGRFVNISDFGPGGSWNSRDPNLSPEEINRRKNMVWSRSSFRQAILTSEFWGTILSPRGEMLLPNASFTVAGDRVIGLPKASPYPTLRWPGTGFSTLPHLLRFDGRGLVQGIKSLWYFMCNLLSLHADNLNWIVNPMTEVDVTALVDQSDTDVYPGKVCQTYGSQNGQQVMRAIERRSQTGDILANMNFADQRFQEGSMLNYSAQGLPGYRAEVTKGEAAQNLDQSMTVVGSMGKNLEDGGLWAIMAGAETVAINITYEELVALGMVDDANKYRVPVSAEFPTGLNLPKLTTGNFHVSGISALMRDQEILKNIASLVLPLAEGKFGNIFLPYLQPYQICRAIEKRMNLVDEKCFVTQVQADAINKAQQTQQEEAIPHQAKAEEAAAELTHQKAESEAAKAEMLRAKALEHEGKATMTHAQGHKALQEAIHTAGTPIEIPGQEGPEAPPIPATNLRENVSIEKFYPLLARSEQEQVLRQLGIDPDEGIKQLDTQVPGAGIGNPTAAPKPEKPAKPAAKKPKEGK